MFVPRKQRDGNNHLWTVGYYVIDTDGTVWEPVRDFKSEMEAWRFIHYLNGGGQRDLFNS